MNFSENKNVNDYALALDTFNDRGFIPFQFSSKLTQAKASMGGIKGLLPGLGSLGASVANLSSKAGKFLGQEQATWYEMWINPQKVSLKQPFQQKRQHTAGSIVTFHYRPDVQTMSVGGVCGWIARNPQSEKEQSAIIKYKNPKKWKSVNDALGVPSNTQRKNSPRIFLQRLREMAQEPMYYIDTEGIEHYNIKYIKIFTKQYPKGVLCEGYYTSFEVPEEGEDVQTINYSFEYIIEIMTSLEDLKSMGGMFGIKV